ncbi:hypothetical protein AXY1_82 [Achromobacter phage AXY1]|nr:hypothetical protein AXY1_82 [Achromobacter phage AXY1]
MIDATVTTQEMQPRSRKIFGDRLTGTRFRQATSYPGFWPRRASTTITRKNRPNSLYRLFSLFSLPLINLPSFS